MRSLNCLMILGELLLNHIGTKDGVVRTKTVAVL